MPWPFALIVPAHSPFLSRAMSRPTRLPSSSLMSPFMRSDEAFEVAFTAWSAISPPVCPANGPFGLLSAFSSPGRQPVSETAAAVARQRAASAVRRMTVP